MDYAMSTQQYGLSHECAHVLKVEIPNWERDVSALLLIDGKVHSTCLSSQSTLLGTGSSAARDLNKSQWLLFPIRIRDLPLTSKIVFRVNRGERGIFYATMTIFQSNATVKQGRQLLILHPEGGPGGPNSKPGSESESKKFSKQKSQTTKGASTSNLRMWDKLLDLADRGLLSDNGGISRDMIQYYRDNEIIHAGRDILVLHLPCFTYPTLYSEALYANSVSLNTVYGVAPIDKACAVLSTGLVSNCGILSGKRWTTPGHLIADLISGESNKMNIMNSNNQLLGGPGTGSQLQKGSAITQQQLQVQQQPGNIIETKQFLRSIMSASSYNQQGLTSHRRGNAASNIVGNSNQQSQIKDNHVTQNNNNSQQYNNNNLSGPKNDGMFIARQRILCPLDVLPQSIPFTNVLFSTWTPEVDLEAHHAGLGFNYFTPLLDYELEQNSEHPSHLKYLRLEKKLEYESRSDKIARPNADELRRLNDIVRRPKRSYTVEEKLLLFKFRFTLCEQKEALSKFLLVVDWSDVDESQYAIKLMHQWAPVDVDAALELLSKDFQKNTEVRQYAVSRLEQATEEELKCYLLQLVQALRYESSSIRKSKDSVNDDESGKPDIVEKTQGQEVQEKKKKEQTDSNKSKSTKSAKDHGIGKNSLLAFLVRRAVESVQLATRLHWYLLAEIDDESEHVFMRARQYFLDVLDQQYPKMSKIINDQIVFRRKLLWALRVAKSRKRDSLEVKTQRFQDALAGKPVVNHEDGIEGTISLDVNNLNKLPMIVDPTKYLVKIIPSKCFLIKSAMYPAVIATDVCDDSGLVFQRSYMFKEGDDLRQDQLVLNLMILMDNILKKYGLDLKLMPYSVIAASTVDGFIEFVAGAADLSKLLEKHKKDLYQFFKFQSRENERAKLASKKNSQLSDTETQNQNLESDDREPDQEILDNFILSCAGYCVITYILGIGDRHNDNLMIEKHTGKMFHIDFGFILGKDPKPYAPPIKINREMISGMGPQGGINSAGYQKFLNNACQAFKILRRHMNLVVNLLYLMTDAGIKDLPAKEAEITIKKVQDKFQPDLSDEQADIYLLNLLETSVSSLFGKLNDWIHDTAMNFK